MTRQDALDLFNGSFDELAAAVSLTRSRISQWPPEGPLPQRDADRVMGAALRLGKFRLKGDHPQRMRLVLDGQR